MTTTRRRIVSGLIACALFAGASVPASLGQSTAGAENLGTFKSWTAWKGTDETGIVCFIAADPESSEPKEVGGKPINRDPAVFLIVHRKGLGTRNEAQTKIGYPFSKEVRPAALVDGESFTMLSENSAAWLSDTGIEGNFVERLKAGTQLVVKGTSLRGTNTTDTYSLAGFTLAMAAIDKACA
jgi:hypothetical protein